MSCGVCVPQDATVHMYGSMKCLLRRSTITSRMTDILAVAIACQLTALSASSGQHHRRKPALSVDGYKATDNDSYNDRVQDSEFDQRA